MKRINYSETMSNSRLNEQEYNQGNIVLKSSPKTIFIQVAGPCNSSCVFCSRGKEYEIFNLNLHNRRFEKTLYPFIAKADTLVLSGSGEFLRLPEAESILEFFDNNFPQVEKLFFTNGSPLLPAICQKITASNSRYTMHVSLHASNPSLHRVMTRMDNFNTIIEQISYLLKARKSNGNLRVNLIFVATTLNIEDLPNFVRLAADLKVDRVICYYNFIYIPTQKYLSCFFKQELTNKMLDEALMLAGKLGMAISLPPKFRQESYPKMIPCSEPFTQIMLDCQGHALPCDASEDCHEILEATGDLMNIWNSLYYQNLRKALLNGTASCFKHCLRANPASVNDFNSHVIHRGKRDGQDMGVCWGDNF